MAALTITVILLASCLSYLMAQALSLVGKERERHERKELELLNRLMEKCELPPIPEEVLRPMELGEREEEKPPEPDLKPQKQRLQFKV